MTSGPNPVSAPGLGRRPLGGGSLTFSIAIHVIAIAVVFWVPSLQPDPLYYPTVELRIMSTPPPQAPPPEEPEPQAPEDELVVETPEEPEPPKVVEEDPIPVLEEEPEPEPEPDTTETPEPEQEEAPPPEDIPVPAEPQDEDEEDEGVADLQVRQEGFKADYPEYYARLLVQVRRCLQRTSEGRTAQNLAATVRFVVERNGSTADFGVEKTSGNAAFDIAVLGALECAGMVGRLGPLPDDYPYEVLRIILEVSPRGGGEVVLQAEDKG